MFFGSGRGVKGKVSLQESCLRQPFWLMPGVHQNVAIEERKKRKCDDSQGLQEGHNLSKKLLHLWSLGKLSATGLQELAQASVSDGLQSQDIMELCGLGSFGAYPNNCHRDLLRLLKNKLKNSRHGGLKESPTFSIQVPALDSKEENPSTMATCHMVLPHLFVWQLFQSYPQLAPSLFGVQKLKAFWSGLKPDDPRLWGWGLKESQKAKTIPLWLHGDGVEFSTDTLLTFSWGPSLFTPQGLKESQEQNASHSMDSSFLVTAWPKSATDSKTWDAIHAVMAWSFTALFHGLHPEADWQGNPLPPHLARLAKKPLTKQGYSFWIFNFLGDLEYYANHLNFPHWSSHKFCWLCDCNKTDPNKNPYDFTDNPGWQLTSFEGLKESPCTNHCLFSIPGGLPEYRVCLDVLHTLDLGVTARLAGSILHSWAFPPGSKKKEGTGNTAGIWAMLKDAYLELSIKEKFNNIVLSMFCAAEKPFSQPAKLRGHAGEIRHFIPALALVAWKKASESQAFAHMAECCHHLAKFYSIIGEDDFFMKNCKQAEQCLKESMVHYIWLHKRFDDGVRFTLTPKCHFLAHIAKMLHFQNTATCWTYKQESFMGYISTLGHSCSHGTRAVRLSESFIAKYIMALQLKVNDMV